MKKIQNDGLEDKIEDLALSHGANLVGICSATSLEDKDFSDPHYLLPDAKSVITYAIKFDDEIVMNYLLKRNYDDYLKLCHEEGEVTKQLKKIGDRLKGFLEEKGYEAVNCDCNFNYRNVNKKGESVVNSLRLLIDLINKQKDETQKLTKKEKKTLGLLKRMILAGLRNTPMNLIPNFSHRCAAVAAGLGRIGWSGNLVTKDYGARILLNSVLTDAKLEADAPLKDNPCVGCKLCEKACQGGLFSRNDSQTVKINDMNETIGQRNSYAYCIAVCSGMIGQNKFQEWSTWSPYTLEDRDYLPQDDTVEEYVQNMFADNVEHGGKRAQNVLRLVENTYLGRNKKPAEDFRPSCGFCQLVCAGTMQKKKTSYKAIINSGNWKNKKNE
jgi:epoxyqueuosine reductase QueG